MGINSLYRATLTVAALIVSYGRNTTVQQVRQGCEVALIVLGKQAILDANHNQLLR